MWTRGKVFRKRVSEGSKSEREAVCVRTERGSYLLRRAGGHPFEDPVLDELVGKEVSFLGALHGQTLIVREWRVAEES